MTPQGPADKPWEQNLGGKEVDTSKYKKPGPYRICFSNAGVDNPWRVVGWTTMQAQVQVLKNDIKSFTVADAQGKDRHRCRLRASTAAAHAVPIVS